MSEKLLFPGDFIANAEEFLPGEGTYVEDGKVCASEVGTVKKDLDKRVASVKCTVSKTPAMQKAGLVVLGVVAKTGEKAGFIDLFPSEDGNGRYFPVPASTVLRVNNVRSGFVKSLDDEFKIGDIVRVKIISAEPNNVLVSTEGPHLGVIKAFCVKCRTPLVKKGNELVCPSCGWKDHRHMADDYGNGVE